MVNVAKIGTATREIGAWLKAGGYKYVAETKPQYLTNIKGLKYSRNLPCDTAKFTEITYTSEQFVKSLTKIKGKDNLDTVNIIKNTILRKMGYRNPELLKVDVDSYAFALAEANGALGGYNPCFARLDFGKNFLNISKENQIALLYHELDHMDKFVKLYKALGAKKFEIFMKETSESSPLYEVITKRFGSCETPVNLEFYKQMSEGLNIQGFDVKKWSKAVKEYSGLTPNYSDKYKYYCNPLEDSAYNLQSKIQKILGLSVETARDLFPKNYTKIIDLLKKHGITDFREQETIIQQAMAICQIKNVDNRLVEIYRKKINGIKLNASEMEFAEKICLDFEKNLTDIKQNIDFTQKVCTDVERYFSKGLFTPEEIINNCQTLV